MAPEGTVIGAIFLKSFGYGAQIPQERRLRTPGTAFLQLPVFLWAELRV